MKYLTTIDTVSLQIDTYDEVTRNFIVDGILSLLHKNKLYIAQKDYPINLHSNFFIREYKIYSQGVVLASIRMGSFSMKNTLNNIVTTYYIAVEFAGLKRYHDQTDAITNKTLLGICAYLNSRNIFYKLTGLDISIDLHTKFENVLALCTKRSPKTSYYMANEAQFYPTTYYIEKISEGNEDEVVQRSYLYDKSFKENLPYAITRFELKLEQKFFNKYRDTLVYSIAKTFKKYHVMYVPVKKERQYLMEQYDNHAILRDRDIKRIGFDNYRCHFDITVVNSFIVRIFSIKEQDLLSS
ncbi:hypothetical protein [Sulfuricurvum sp.]|uniref:hypothetical protein n=1 Tax=Sulfuricurvum sp. TaxID=2025608 RepID=UPI0035648CDD